MEKLSALERRRPRRSDRSSITNLSILRRIAMLGVLVGGIEELAQDKDPHPQRAPVTRNQTMEDVLYQCRAALGPLNVVERRATPEDEHLPPDPGIAPVRMTGTAASKLWKICKNFCSSPSDTAGEISDDVRASVRYVRDYRMSEEKVQTTDSALLDCNDYANITCQKLERLRFPMYLLSTWPEDPQLRFDEGWHQMAACKLADDCYLIFDDHGQTLWQGSLQSFGRKYGSKVTMRIIPRVGISAFAEPKYDNGISKFLVQTKHGIADEHEMQSLDIHERRESFRIASR
ncbi:MAG: hypothetical protein PHO20_01285 [Candidatus Peribacteraceae bacterium]|nr:hypothetical protein [Candidatus Peribacteraceae bacterium]MDD5739381.1 hypothetical protein [Candidatus Peribacteraceae bacterium]